MRDKPPASLTRSHCYLFPQHPLLLGNKTLVMSLAYSSPEDSPAGSASESLRYETKSLKSHASQGSSRCPAQLSHLQTLYCAFLRALRSMAIKCLRSKEENNDQVRVEYCFNGVLMKTPSKCSYITVTRIWDENFS